MITKWRQRRRSSLIETYHRYVRNPFPFWEGAGVRQAEKLERYKAGLITRLGCPEDQLAGRLLEQAMRRKGDPAVYVTGMGGSGSHWLAGMLGELPRFFDADEVYFPKALLDAFPEEPDMAARVADALHMLHARIGPVDHERAVNCAAGAARTLGYRQWDPDATVVYLVRDPRDQVLSTTFRKKAYRNQVAGGLSDREYLRKRCTVSRVERRKVLEAGDSADVMTRYEDLRADPVGELSRVLDAVGESIDHARLAEVTGRYDADRIRAGKGQARGNLNTRKRSSSWRDESPEWVTAIHSELADVIESLGYPFGSCLGGPAESRYTADLVPPPGIRIRRWDGEVWSRNAEGGGALAEILEDSDDHPAWLSDSPIFGLCAVRLGKISDSWLDAALANPHLRTLDLGTVDIDEDQLDLLSHRGQNLVAVNLWRSVPADQVDLVRARLPESTVFA